MTILDARSGIDRLTPTPHSIITEATERFERSLEGLGWEIWDHADADTFKTVKSDKVREKMSDDLNEAGDKLRTAVIALLRALEDEVELEVLRLP